MSAIDQYLVEPVAQEPESNAKPSRAGCVVASVIAGISIFINISLAVIAVFYLSVTSGGKTSHRENPHVPKKHNLTCQLGFPELGASIPRMLIKPSNDSTSAAICWDSQPDIDPRVVSPYELQVDDWWTKSGFYTIYAGSGRSFEHNGLVPGFPYRYRLRVRRDIGPHAQLIDVLGNTTMPNKGGCGNPDDMKTFRDNRKTIKKHIQVCMETSLNNDKRALKCIKNKGLSETCSMCWIAEGHCTLSHCMPACFSPASEKCVSCSKKNCFPGCVTCSGTPQWTFPP